MRRVGASPYVPDDVVTDISAFQGVVSIVLRDGEITREEKRLVIKLASLLGLDENDPKRIYDAIVTGEKLDGGRVLDKTEQLRVYSGMFQTAYLNASISEDEYFVVAYLRLMFQIDDDENDAVINAIHDELEEHVEKNVFQVVEKGLDQAKDVVDGLVKSTPFNLTRGGSER